MSASPLAAAAAETGPPAMSRRQIAAAVVGNGLEFYDFTTYALFAVQIGQAFFPNHTPFVSLMLSLTTFAVGFIGRPIGAVVIGLAGDRAGRRPAMLLSFALMGLGLVGLVLTPPYTSIGAAAPALLLLFRLVQGFALGGEVGPTTAFLIEAAASDRRGLVGSWQSASQAVAALAGSVVGLALSHWLGGAQLEAYGWRIAFAIGALVLPFGFWARKGLPETLHRRAEARPARRLTGLARPMIVGLAMIMSFTTSTYVLLYMTTFASQTLHMSASAAFGASVANGVTGTVFALLGGAASDRFGRKPVMIGARVLLLLAVLPVFLWIVRVREPAALILGTALIGAVSSASVGVALVSLTEALGKEVRSTGLALVYAIGVSVFGGMAQPYVAWLIKATGSPLAPAWYLMAAAAIGVVAMAFMPETRWKDVHAEPLGRA